MPIHQRIARGLRGSRRGERHRIHPASPESETILAALRRKQREVALRFDVTVAGVFHHGRRQQNAIRRPAAAAEEEIAGGRGAYNPAAAREPRACAGVMRRRCQSRASTTIPAR